MTAIDLRTFDQPTTDRLSGRARSAAAVAVIVALAAVARFGLIAWPFWNDSGLYVALGRSVARGDVLYRDFYETKLPGAAMLMSAAWRAFGPCWPAYVTAQFAMTLIAAGAIARAVGRHVGAAAALPCFLYTVAHLNFDYAVFTGFQLETIQALFECLAAASAIEAMASGDDRPPFATNPAECDIKGSCDIKRPGPFMSHRGLSAFVTGLAAGVAAMAKPGGAGVAVALVVCLLLGRRWRAVTAVGFGFAIPTAATVLFTVGTGAWPYLPGVLGDIRRYAAGTPMRWEDAVKVLVLLMGLAIPFTLCVIGSGARGFRSAAPGGAPGGATPPLRGRRSRIIPFLALWLLLDLAAAIAQHRMYLYYFLPLAGPAAVLYGLAAKKISPVRMTIGLLPVALLSLTWEACDPAHWSRGLQPAALSAYITANTTPADRVYIDPPGRLTIETDRDPGASAGVLFYWVNDDTAPRRFCDRLIADLDYHRTKYVVLATKWDVPIPPMADGDILTRNPGRRTAFVENWARFRTWLHRHYTVEAAIDGRLVFRRNP
jgi:hypothetical protein